MSGLSLPSLSTSPSLVFETKLSDFDEQLALTENVRKMARLQVLINEPIPSSPEDYPKRQAAIHCAYELSNEINSYLAKKHSFRKGSASSLKFEELVNHHSASCSELMNAARSFQLCTRHHQLTEEYTRFNTQIQEMIAQKRLSGEEADRLLVELEAFHTMTVAYVQEVSDSGLPECLRYAAIKDRAQILLADVESLKRKTPEAAETTTSGLGTELLALCGKFEALKGRSRVSLEEISGLRKEIEQLYRREVAPRRKALNDPSSTACQSDLQKQIEECMGFISAFDRYIISFLQEYVSDLATIREQIDALVVANGSINLHTLKDLQDRVIKLQEMTGYMQKQLLKLSNLQFWQEIGPARGCLIESSLKRLIQRNLQSEGSSFNPLFSELKHYSSLPVLASIPE